MDDTDNPVPRFLQAYQAAVAARDVDALVALYDEDAEVFDAWGAWSHRGRAAWRAVARDWLAAHDDGRHVVEFEDVRTELAPGLAVVHAFVRYAWLDAAGTRRRAMDNRYGAVLRLRDGGWKVVHEHTSAPIDFETSKAIMKR
jgi:uncharacterized protein (TIGR02246 family)